ncbi:hypothetical protein AB1Y20_003422 [Prymnesium parvum]|uniref:Uncharacterized protein n=1 Tax=Prymnesium parvum TaxID=97485 RepID=A0AB34JDI5_PRYPA
MAPRPLGQGEAGDIARECWGAEGGGGDGAGTIGVPDDPEQSIDDQLSRDLATLELSDDDDSLPLELPPAPTPLRGLDELLAAAESSAQGERDDGGILDSLAALEANFSDVGERARTRFALELQQLTSELRASVASGPPADPAGSPSARPSGDGDGGGEEAAAAAEEGDVDEVPWWVLERRQAWMEEAARDAARHDAEARRRALEEEAARESERVAAEEEAALARRLEELRRREEEACAAAARERERARAEAEARRAEAEAARAAAEAAEAEAEREAAERAAASEARRRERQAEREAREAAHRQRIAEAEEARRRAAQAAERERQAQRRMEERKEALRRAAEEEAERQRLSAEKRKQHSGATLVQSVARALLARATRTRLASERKRAKEEEERRAAEEAARAAAAARAAEEERQRRLEEIARREREAEERRRREAEERARREAEEQKRREAEAARREAERQAEEARRKAAEERARAEAAARRGAAVVLQAAARGWRVRTRHGPRPAAARVLQRRVRAAALRREVARRHAQRLAAVQLQSRWRGKGLRMRLEHALRTARFEDDDEFEYEAVDDSWLDAAAAQFETLEATWLPEIPATHTAAVDYSPPSGSREVSARVERGQRADSGGRAGGCESSGLCESGDSNLASEHDPARDADPAHRKSAVESPTLKHSGKADAAKAMAEEWGFTDMKNAAAFMKRQQRMSKMKRASDQRKVLQDPMKRLEALQRRCGDDTTTSSRAGMPKIPRKEALLVSRTEVKPEGLRWLGPNDGSVHGVDRWEAPHELSQASEVNEELEISSISDGPASCFSSDPPNSKLTRIARGGALRSGQNVARINNFLMSPPSSANSATGGLPAGSALQAARAHAANGARPY